jgi:hypothetical protein
MPNPIVNRATSAHECTGGAPGVLERLYAPQEIAEAWQLDESTVRRLFAGEAGVLRLSGGQKHKRTTLRIPAAVVERVQRERSK